MGLPNFLFVLLAIFRSLSVSFSASQSNLAPEINITLFHNTAQKYTTLYIYDHLPLSAYQQCNFTKRSTDFLVASRGIKFREFFIPLASPLNIHEKPPSISSSESMTILPCWNYIRIQFNCILVRFFVWSSKHVFLFIIADRCENPTQSPVYECLLVLLAFLLSSSWMCFDLVSPSSNLQLVSLGIKMSLRFWIMQAVVVSFSVQH